ncbi:hypothetical protein [Escherichia coli]|uniref:hypothetical protein n=1 Tax=Escherichia coli TaxID=562 RepID=UPI00352BD320
MGTTTITAALAWSLQMLGGRTGIAGGAGRRGDNNHHRRISLVITNVGRKCSGGRCLPGQLVAPVI